MKKLFLMTVALIMGVMSAMADEPKGKANVFIDYFSRPSDVPFNWAETVRANILEGIQNTNRVNLIDVDSRSALAIEKTRREQDNASAGDDMDRMKVMTEEGANLLVNGKVNSVSVVKKTSSKGEFLGYEATIGATINVIDPSNGTTVITKTFTLPKKVIGLSLNDLITTANTEDEAVLNVAKLFNKEMKKFVEEAFPTVGKIIELDEENGKEVKTAYINLGSENGMAKGAKFEVRIKRTIGGKGDDGGKVSYKLVGEAEVTDVEGDDLSKIKIKKGGKEILDAFKNDLEVVVRSTK